MTYKAFVSSTYEDLQHHRAHVIRALRKAGIQVDPMEDWTAAADEPSVFSQKRTEGCQLCVLLVAFRRGHCPQGSEESIVQMEYRAALDNGLDILIFLLSEDAPWPHRFTELDSDPLIREWRGYLMEHHGVGFFGYEPDSIEIAPALTRWIAERHAGESSSRETEPQAIRSEFLRTPWLGLEVWQAGTRCALARASGSDWDSSWGSPVRVFLRYAPFELRTPRLDEDETIRVSAWRDASIFHPLTHCAPLDSIPYLRPGTGMADTPYGSGILLLDDEAHHPFARGHRLIENPDGSVSVLFNEILERGGSDSLVPSSLDEVFVVVQVARPGIETLELDSFERLILKLEGRSARA